MKKIKSINYIHFDILDSTNTWAKNNAHTLDLHEVTCITALEQTAGRSRHQRQWFSPPGQNIYCTIFFCLPQNCPYLHNLGQILSLSCATVLKEKGFFPQIKWPNDLLLDGKKVSGILTEITPVGDQLGIILGIGINVNMSEELLKKIDQPATSLAQLSGQTWALEQILEPLLHRFLEDLEQLIAKGFAPFREAYEELLIYKGKVITCYDGVNFHQGICHSINEDGRLNLLQGNGEIKILAAGEVKLV